MNEQLGKIVIVIGIIIIAAGVTIYYAGNRLNFFGKLPGDIRIERGGSGFYFPIVTCIILSVVISLIIRIVQWFIK
jgi:hypothetical protein